MNKNKAASLIAAIAIFLTAITFAFFAATDSKNRMGLSVVAVFWVIIGIFWIYQFVKLRKAF